MPVVDIAGALRGERIFVTGATGFLGKVLVEKLLWSVPEVGRLLLLVRPDGDRTAAERVREEVLGAPLMARLRARHGEGWEAWAASRVEAVAGDLGSDRFGLAPAAWTDLCGRVDRVVASAATVTFDERLDRAVELNARGALRTLALAREAGGVPLVHVSTCFVSGRQCGPVAEALPVLAPATGGGSEAASEVGGVSRTAPGRGGSARSPEVVGVSEASEVAPEVGGVSEVGASEVGAVMAGLEGVCRAVWEAGGGEAAWVAAGAERAARHGFHDVYTLTKALGELLVARDRGNVPVAIVRPAIVESAVEQPIPGWLEAIRVVDPLLVAYGRGRTRVLPGAADVPLELVPVDFVVHAMLAALADLRRGPPATGVRIYQVGSSRNPITLGELVEHAREGFAATPLRDEEGAPIAVPRARFMAPDRLRTRLARRRRLAAAQARALARVGRTGWAPGLAVARRRLEHFERLVDVYRPYLEPGGRYRDDATRALWSRLSPAAQAAFPFDVTAIEWRSYVARVHVPGIVRFALRADSGAPGPDPAPDPARRLAEAVAGAERATTLFGLFADVARRHPDVPALQTFRDGRWLRATYGQALASTANLAWRLATAHGIGHGDRVALWAEGSPEWVVTALAVHRLGAVVVPLDPQWPAAEVAEAARFVDAKLVCAAPRRLPDLLALPGGAGCPAVALAPPWVPEPDAGLLPEAAAMPDAEAASAGEPGGLASILFTSGTTVAPKAVPLTHANYLANVRDLIPLMRLTRERLLSVLPVHHAFEQTVGLFVPLAGASTVSYVAEVRPAEIAWMMAATRPTVLVAVPRLLELLHAGILASVAAGGAVLGLLFRVLFALSRLTGARFGHRLFGKVHRRFGGSLRRIATGGSALEPALGRSFQLMGFEVAEGYGMTETSPVLTVNPWGAIRFGSAGRALPGVEIELRPPADAAGLAPGCGEIWVRGANVMAGYHRNPEATAEVLVDGWLNTGDVGRFDADGYLHLSGRTRDVIVTGAGKNVHPEEVEHRYRGIPGVQELVVLGLPGDGGRGERVAAVVVPRPGAGDGEVEVIRAAIDARAPEVPSYQRPSWVEIWRGELPKTTTLKVQRSRLREAVLAAWRGEGGDLPAPAGAGHETGHETAATSRHARETGGTSPRETAATSSREGEEWVIATVARLTRARPERIRAGDRLADLGVDSLTHVELVGALEARLGRRLDDAAVAGLGRVQDLFDLV